MNFLVLRAFADVSVELSFVGKKCGLSRYLRLTLSCLPESDLKRGLQQHPALAVCLAVAPPSQTGCLLEGLFCREQPVLCAHVLCRSHEKCCSDDSDLG